jgi:hypothetical protein
MATAAILNFFNPQKLPHTTVVQTTLGIFKMAAVAMETAKMLKN